VIRLSTRTACHSEQNHLHFIVVADDVESIKQPKGLQKRDRNNYTFIPDLLLRLLFASIAQSSNFMIIRNLCVVFLLLLACLCSGEPTRGGADQLPLTAIAGHANARFAML
jgi:hypothetical protein